MWLCKVILSYAVIYQILLIGKRNYCFSVCQTINSYPHHKIYESEKNDAKRLSRETDSNTEERELG